jgi:hypothetical protein
MRPVRFAFNPGELPVLASNRTPVPNSSSVSGSKKVAGLVRRAELWRQSPLSLTPNLTALGAP